MDYNWAIEKVVEVTLGSGAVVRCRPVPPYTAGYPIASVKKPEYPFVEVKSHAGGSERLPALQATPEYRKWQLEMDEYNNQVAEEMMKFNLLHGIIDWKFPGMDEFASEPPDGWQVPIHVRRRYHITSADPTTAPDEHRFQFIQFALLQYQEDADLVDQVTAEPFAPLTDEELKTMLTPFVLNGKKVLPVSQLKTSREQASQELPTQPSPKSS